MSASRRVGLSHLVSTHRLMAAFALAALCTPNIHAQSSSRARERERERERAERQRELREEQRERDRERNSRDRNRDDDDDGPQERQDNAFSWSGVIPSGRRIMIRNVNGGITVQRSTSGKVEVTADKRWRRGNPSDVRIEQMKVSGDEVLICAMWQPDARCDEDGIHTPRSSWRRNDNNRNDVSVRFLVKVPEGVRVDVSTVNGGLDVDGVTTDVQATTVNGSIEARSAGGPVRAKTVNGSINVSMGSMGRAEDLEYETVNGALTLELPSNFGAQLELSTVNGRVSTDFPITVSGSFSPRRLRGTVGNGSTHVTASTVNGSVTLIKRN